MLENVEDLRERMKVFLVVGVGRKERERERDRVREICVLSEWELWGISIYRLENKYLDILGLGYLG